MMSKMRMVGAYTCLIAYSLFFWGCNVEDNKPAKSDQAGNDFAIPPSLSGSEEGRFMTDTEIPRAISKALENSSVSSYKGTLENEGYTLGPDSNAVGIFAANGDDWVLFLPFVNPQQDSGKSTYIIYSKVVSSQTSETARFMELDIDEVDDPEITSEGIIIEGELVPRDPSIEAWWQCMVAFCGGCLIACLGSNCGYAGCLATCCGGVVLGCTIYHLLMLL